MPRKPTGRPNQRPEKAINWKTVDDLLVAGCLGTEIASHFDMHPDTLYRRIEEQYGMGFTAYSTEKRSKGDSLLRAKQFDKALKGDNTLLIWLGKNRLKQVDSPAEISVDSNTIKQFNDIMTQMGKLQGDRSIEDKSINTETKS